jgi:hypothetical protein
MLGSSLAGRWTEFKLSRALGRSASSDTYVKKSETRTMSLYRWVEAELMQPRMWWEEVCLEVHACVHAQSCARVCVRARGWVAGMGR